MSREDQHMGITTAAMRFLDKNEIKPEACHACFQFKPMKLEKIGVYSGFNEYSLFRHQLIGGGYADEFLQAAPWSSGPMFFIGLRLNDGREFLWSDKEIEHLCQ